MSDAEVRELIEQSVRREIRALGVFASYYAEPFVKDIVAAVLNDVEQAGYAIIRVMKETEDNGR